MQRDLLMESMPSRELKQLEASLIRDLGDGRGRSYVQRQALALSYVRCLVERKIREAERELGLRAEKP